MISKKLLLAAAATALAVGTADAKIVNVTWTGVIAGDQAIDVNGHFGDAGGNLSGAAFVTHYRFDTALGALQQSAGEYRDIQGGSGSSRSPITPILSSSITINGHTMSVAGSNFGEIYSEFTSTPQFYTESDDDDFGMWNYLQPPRDTVPGGYATPSFADFDGDVSGIDGGGGFYDETELFDMINQHLTISSEAAVPEPASWAMMVGGFGLIGGALRGRRRVALSFG